MEKKSKVCDSIFHIQKYMSRFNVCVGQVSILLEYITDLSCIIYRNRFSVLFDHCGQTPDRACSPTKHGEESLAIVIGRKVNLDGSMSKKSRTVLEL